MRASLPLSPTSSETQPGPHKAKIVTNDTTKNGNFKTASNGETTGSLNKLEPHLTTQPDDVTDDVIAEVTTSYDVTGTSRNVTTEMPDVGEPTTASDFDLADIILPLRPIARRRLIMRCLRRISLIHILRMEDERQNGDVCDPITDALNLRMFISYKLRQVRSMSGKGVVDLHDTLDAILNSGKLRGNIRVKGKVIKIDYIIDWCCPIG